jgi:hypothetical protein
VRPVRGGRAIYGGDKSGGRIGGRSGGGGWFRSKSDMGRTPKDTITIQFKFNILQLFLYDMH